MKIKIDNATFTPEDFGPKLIPVGEYVGKIEKVLSGQSEKKGTPFIELTFNLKIDAKTRRKGSQRFYVSAGAAPITKRTLAGFYVSAFDDIDADYDFADLEGNDVNVKVGIESSEGYDDKNTFSPVLSSEERAKVKAFLLPSSDAPKGKAGKAKAPNVAEAVSDESEGDEDADF